MVTSKGVTGVSEESFVVHLATLGVIGIPLESLAFIAGVDWFLDIACTTLNIVSNALVISKWQDQYNTEKAKVYDLS